MTKKFSSFKGHQLITESWRTFVDGSETSAQGSEMELEERKFADKFTDEQREEYNRYMADGLNAAQAAAIVTGGPDKKAEYEKMKNTTSRTKAVDHVYNLRPGGYSAFGRY